MRKTLHTILVYLVNPENADERKRSGKSHWKQLAIRFKVRNRIFSNESTRGCSSGSWKQHAVRINSKHTLMREHLMTDRIKKIVHGASSRQEFRNMRNTNHQYTTKILPVPAKRVGRITRSSSTFSMMRTKQMC